MMLARTRLRPSMTPMIDVVFLLLLFFMLSTQLQDTSVIELPLGAQAGGAVEPLLVELGETLSWNGEAVSQAEITRRLQSETPQTLAVRPGQNVRVQALIAFIDEARLFGWSDIILVENKQ